MEEEAEVEVKALEVEELKFEEEERAMTPQKATAVRSVAPAGGATMKTSEWDEKPSPQDNSDDDFEVTPARAKSRKRGKRIREEGEEEEEAPKAKKKKDAKKKKEKTPRQRSNRGKVITRVQPALHSNIECVVHNLILCTTHSIWAAWHTISDCAPDIAICVPWQPNSLRRDGRLPPWPSPSTCAKPSPFKCGWSSCRTSPPAASSGKAGCWPASSRSRTAVFRVPSARCAFSLAPWEQLDVGFPRLSYPWTCLS